VKSSSYEDVHVLPPLSCPELGVPHDVIPDHKSSVGVGPDVASEKIDHVLRFRCRIGHVESLHDIPVVPLTADLDDTGRRVALKPTRL
jgi:hypothetical protein